MTGVSSRVCVPSATTIDVSASVLLGLLARRCARLLVEEQLAAGSGGAIADRERAGQ
jgi:hypothetical protein